MLIYGSKFCKQFLKRSPKEHSCEIISKSDHAALSGKKSFKEFFRKFHLVAMPTRGFDGIKFCEQFLKRTFHGKFLPCLVEIGPAVWKEKMFKGIVDATQQTTDSLILKAPLGHGVLR